MVNPEDCHVIILAAGCSRRLASLTQARPKSFLLIRGRRIIDYTLDTLENRGFLRVTIVTGYLAEQFHQTIGIKRGRLSIQYEYNTDFQNSGHGWSLYLTRNHWEKEKRPVILIHADTFFDPKIIDLILKSGATGTLAIDETCQSRMNDRPIAYGKNGKLYGIEVGNEGRPNSVGEVMCLNFWSPSFMGEFFSFMEPFLKENGPNYTWESLLTSMLQVSRQEITYTPCGKYGWMNINRQEDYLVAENQVYSKIFGR